MGGYTQKSRTRVESRHWETLSRARSERDERRLLGRHSWLVGQRSNGKRPRGKGGRTGSGEE